MIMNNQGHLTGWMVIGLLILSAIVVLGMVVLVYPEISKSVNEANLPIEGRAKFIVAKDVVSYGTTGSPPCLEIHDNDCITSYEYSITGNDGDTYRLDTEQFPVRFEDNTDPRFSTLREGGVVAISCSHISSNSRDNPKNLNPSDVWTVTISDKNLYFGCEVSSVGSWLFARGE